MNKLGYRVELCNRKAKIHDVDGKLIGSDVDRTLGNLFYLDLSNETFLFAQKGYVWLWYKRLCHVKFYNSVNISKIRM